MPYMQCDIIFTTDAVHVVRYYFDIIFTTDAVATKRDGSCSQRMRFFGGGGLRPPPKLLHHTGKAAVVHLSSTLE
jgi:hypothetical protein